MLGLSLPRNNSNSGLQTGPIILALITGCQDVDHFPKHLKKFPGFPDEIEVVRIGDGERHCQMDARFR